MALTKISGEVIQSNIDISSTGIITATTFSGNVTGDLTGNVTGNINSTGVSTVTTLNATTISGVSTIGVTTATVTTLNATTISGVSTIGVTTATVTTLTVNGNAYPSAGPLSNRNLIINGAMQVWQRGTSETNFSTYGYYTADRWLAGTGAGTIDMEQSTDTPPGFAYSLKISVNTTGSAANQQSHVDYYIEAQDLQHLKWGTGEEEPITVSFWMKSTSTQTKYLWLYAQDAGDHIARPFSVKQANVWERISITVPGNTLGVIANDTGRGLYVRFTFDAGSDYTGGTPTTWTAISSSRFAGIGNFMSDANNEFYLTGVQLEVGTVATPFEHRSYGEELALCQRYYETGFSKTYVGGATNSGIAIATNFKVQKRTSRPNQTYSAPPGGMSNFQPTGNEAITADGFSAIRSSSNEIAFSWVSSAEL